MALIIGDQTAGTGMSKATYDQLQSVLEPALGGLSAEARSQSVRCTRTRVVPAIGASGIISATRRCTSSMSATRASRTAHTTMSFHSSRGLSE